MSQSHGANDVLIFSVFNKDLSIETNIQNHFNLMQFLKEADISFTSIKGMYDNHLEWSVLLDERHESLVKTLCKAYSQECYLRATTHMHGMRNAYFVYLEDGREEFMGYLRSCSKEKAMSENGWTYRPDKDTYWIISDTDETSMTKLKEMGWYE